MTELTDDVTAHAFAVEYRPKLAERLARALGFRHAHQPRPEETAEFPARLRVLLTGKIEIELVSQTDVEVHHAKTRSDVGTPW